MSLGLTRADETALRLLICQRTYNPRFDVKSLDFGRINFGHSIVFDSIQSFCENSRATLDDMKINGLLPDGYTICRMCGILTSYIVLCNTDIKSPGRRRFTLAHEIGHILLEHSADSPFGEHEADRFAAQLLLPRVFVWGLYEQSGFSISARELAGIFGVSTAAAEIRLKSLTRENPPVFSPDEEILLDKFGCLLPLPDGPIVDC